MDDIEIEKSNMSDDRSNRMLGKTYLVKTLARLLDVPLAIADATSLTEAGLYRRRHRKRRIQAAGGRRQ